MNLALYGQGGKRWAMTERSAAALSRDRDHLQIGRSLLSWNGDVLTAEIDEVTAPFPTVLRGSIRLHVPAPSTHVVTLDNAGRHVWSPIAPGARVEVAMRRPDRSWQGHAYFDTNAGAEPLEEGFRGWHWCRARVADGVKILYHGEHRGGTKFCTALHYDSLGRPVAFDAPPEAALGRSAWGVRRSTRADTGALPRVVKTLEDTPFYARSVISTRIGGEDAQAVHESLSLDRFKMPWVQAMLPFKAPRW